MTTETEIRANLVEVEGQHDYGPGGCRVNRPERRGLSNMRVRPRSTKSCGAWNKTA